MRKTILIILVALASSVLHADDVIILKSSVRIDGQIESISNTELRYKKTNDLTGQIFVTPLSDVSLIIWENGEVISYADIKSSTIKSDQKQKEQKRGKIMTIESNKKPIETKKKWNLTPSDTTLMGISVGFGLKKIPVERVYDYNVDYNNVIMPTCQLGYIFQPEFKYGIGVKTGVNFEFGGAKGYNSKQSMAEISMNIPIQCSYRCEWFKGFSTLIYTGPILDFGVLMKVKMGAQPYSDAYNLYSDVGYEGFNCLWGFGIAAQYNGWRLAFDAGVGMVDKYMQEIYWGDQWDYYFGRVIGYIHKPMTLSIAYMFNYKKNK